LGGGTETRIQVDRGGSATSPEVFLTYDVAVGTCDEGNCRLIESGGGLIPPEDFTGDANHLKLRTNTRNIPNFFITAGVGGLIDIEWRKVRGFEFRLTGTLEQREEGVFRSVSKGSSISFSAAASGSVIGIPIPRGEGGAIMGASREMQIEFHHF
jgi:hypothetical protein